MADRSGRNELGRRRLVTVVLRLVLDHRGALTHGEIVNGGNRLRGRFAGWDRLVPALRAWVREELGDGTPPATDPGASERKDHPCP